MKLSVGILLILSDSAKAQNFGLEFVDCASDYFREGAEWILQDYYPQGTTARLCQNRNGHVHKYATLMDIPSRIPIYSAAVMMRDPDQGTNSRPDSNWHHVAFGLCLDANFDFSAIADRSFYSNIDECQNCWDYCGKYQAVTRDYYDNTSNLKIDRGHLLPNGVTNQDSLWQRTTMTLTNVAPQHSAFNQIGWNQLECMVRRYLENEMPREYAHIITGTYGTKLIMNENNQYPDKNEVRLPQYYWKAFCKEDSDGTAYSWVYMQINENDQINSEGELMMTTSEFSRIYYDNHPIFDSKCQNASLGPWAPIKADWNTVKKRWGCDYTHF